jgi:prevent-host-death family protein
MVTTMTAQDAAVDLRQLLDRVRLGEEVIISDRGQPVARLVPMYHHPARRQPGSAAGRIVIQPDFDTPLPQDILDAFEA